MRYRGPSGPEGPKNCSIPGLAEAERVEDPISKKNTMQAGRRPAQLGGQSPSKKCVEDELQHQPTSREPVIIPIESRRHYHSPILILKSFHLVVLPLIDDIVNDGILVTLTA